MGEACVVVIAPDAFSSDAGSTILDLWCWCGGIDLLAVFHGEVAEVIVQAFVRVDGALAGSGVLVREKEERVEASYIGSAQPFIRRIGSHG
jgi:hypothetical protein